MSACSANKIQIAPTSLEQLSLFKGCGANFMEKLTKSGHEHRHPKGKLLCLHGDEAEHFFIIKSGWVKLFRETIDGTQAITDILSHNSVFGETAIFENGVYAYSAEIVKPAIIASYPIDLLKSEIESNHKLAMNMLRSMAHHRRQQDKEIEHLELQNAPQRIGCFLLKLTPQDAEGPVTIHLPYDKTLIAARLGMQPETFSRALGKLKKSAGVTIKGATVEMDSLKQLIQFACAACSSKFPCDDLTK
ncbi:MAG: Crp/Fnr family transcriptional regulator [Pseudomonadota bacterium]|nr:Crp/Fnr family transcriptional regulator [Pseudomonadota bacterium]